MIHPAPGFRPPGLSRIVSATTLLLLGGTVGVAGQGGPDCDVPSHGGLVMQTIQSIAGEDRIFYFKTPVLWCPGGVRIAADSAVVYESTNYSQFWGNVAFSDENSRLTADQAQYFSETRRLVASGNTVLTDQSDGSVIRGDQMTLIRAGPQREEDFLTVSGRRPHATLYPSRREEPDTAGAETQPDTAGAEVRPDTSGAGIQLDTVGAEIQPDTAGALEVVPDSVLDQVSDTTGFQPVFDSVLVVAEDTIPALEPADSLPSLEEAPDTVSPGFLPDTTVRPEEGPRVPYEIDARTFTLEGSRYFRAAGSVVVTRDSLEAQADSLEYDQEEGTLFLNQDASVTTAQTDLSARTIRMFIPEDEVREALATGRAVLEGEDLRLLAPLITLFFSQGTVERLVAVRDAVADSIFAEMDEEERAEREAAQGPIPPAAEALGLTGFPRRPYALAQDFILEGDSVEVWVPQEVLREVRAMGRARGESAGRDSLNAEGTPSIIQRDWLEGDTIVALFQPPGEGADSEGVEAEAPALEVVPVSADSAQEEYALERLVARGQARSMYRMAASDSTVAEEPGRFAVHYVVGDEITILLNSDGEAETMEVLGQTRGIHLEPTGELQASSDSLAAADTASVSPDTTGILPDTTGTPPDTTRTPPDTTATPPDTASISPDGVGVLRNTGRALPGAVGPVPDSAPPGREGFGAVHDLGLSHPDPACHSAVFGTVVPSGSWAPVGGGKA